MIAETKPKAKLSIVHA